MIRGGDADFFVGLNDPTNHITLRGLYIQCRHTKVSHISREHQRVTDV